MKRVIGLMTVLAACSAITAANAAADSFYLGTPSYGGNGCPAGSVRTTLSPDHTTASVLFDKYQTAAGSPTGQMFDRKSCNLAVPVHLPAGMTMSVYQIDYRGFTAVPQGGYTKYSAEYFFAGQQGPTSSRTFQGPFFNDFTVTDNVGAAVWAPCGANTNLRANTNLLTVSNGQREEATGSIDSADIHGGIVYYLAFRYC